MSMPICSSYRFIRKHIRLPLSFMRKNAGPSARFFAFTFYKTCYGLDLRCVVWYSVQHENRHGKADGVVDGGVGRNAGAGG